MKKGYLFIIISTILFSSMEIALKTISSEFNPIQLTLERFFIGGLVLLPFALCKLRELKIHLNKDDLKQFAFLGFMCVVVSMVFYQLAILYTKASVVAVIFSCNPIFVLFFANIFLQEKIYKHNIISLLLELFGIILIINPFNSHLSPLGIIFTLLSAITFALYGVIGKKSTKKFGGIIVTCFSFVFGSIEMIFLILLCKTSQFSLFLQSININLFNDISLFAGFSFNNLIPIVYIFVFVTGFGYACYFKAMEETSANTTSLIFFFKPALSPILAFLILNEIIPFNMILGILLILLGSIYTILNQNKFIVISDLETSD